MEPILLYGDEARVDILYCEDLKADAKLTLTHTLADKTHHLVRHLKPT